MQGFRALIVHGSEQVCAGLADELRRLGVAADVADPEDAVDMLQREEYGALVLDDELPGGGSLQVYDALSRLGPRRPPAVMVSVPRSLLAAARRASSGEVEYVAVPDSEPEIARLALRIRSRLVRSGLAQEFGGPPPQEVEEPGDRPARRALRSGSAGRRPLVLFIVLLVIILVITLFVRVLTQAPRRESRVPVALVPHALMLPPDRHSGDPLGFRAETGRGEYASGRRKSNPRSPDR